MWKCCVSGRKVSILHLNRNNRNIRIQIVRMPVEIIHMFISFFHLSSDRSKIFDSCVRMAPLSIRRHKHAPIGVMLIANKPHSITVATISICIALVLVTRVNEHHLPKKMKPYSICSVPNRVSKCGIFNFIQAKSLTEWEGWAGPINRLFNDSCNETEY